MQGRKLFGADNPMYNRSYSNVDLEKTKILLDNKGKAGIYVFTNLINGKKYIGSSENLRRRFMEYFNINNLMRAKYMVIYRAMLKYGYSSFKLEILEYCEVSELITREKYYIDL